MAAASRRRACRGPQPQAGPKGRTQRGGRGGERRALGEQVRTLELPPPATVSFPFLGAVLPLSLLPLISNVHNRTVLYHFVLQTDSRKKGCGRSGGVTGSPVRNSTRSSSIEPYVPTLRARRGRWEGRQIHSRTAKRWVSKCRRARTRKGRTSLDVMGETTAWSASRCSSKSSAAALELNSSSQSCDFLISSLMVLRRRVSNASLGSKRRAYFLSELSSFPPSPASSAS